jgi:hypothetical protein
MRKINRNLNDDELTLVRLFVIYELPYQIVRYTDRYSIGIVKHDWNSFYINIFDKKENIMIRQFYKSFGKNFSEYALVEWINECLKKL